MTENRKRRADPDEIKENSDSKIPHLDDSPVDNGILNEIMGELKEIREEIKKNQENNEKKLDEFRMEMKIEMLKQKEESLNSKSAQLNNSSLIQLMIKEITGELKEMRNENQEIKEELKLELLEENLEIRQQMQDNKKEMLEEMKKIREKVAPEIPIGEAIVGEWECVEYEMRKEMVTLKSELLAETQKKLEEIERKNEKKLSELKNEMLEEMQKIQKDPGAKEIPGSRIAKIEPPSETAPEIPIREAIVGEWKCVEYENFEGYKKLLPYSTLERFSRNFKYFVENALLNQTGGDYRNMREGENVPESLRLFVENNHLKTVCDYSTIDRDIQDGRLYVAVHQNGEVWKRIYEKI